ncbi:MAG: transglutaminase domain-containing protein [Lachnospiraceae bacterium]|nr:transglutaminase domain-containing protein [Lachnospiraceae bacterium]
MERVMSSQAGQYAAGKYQETLPLLKGRAAEVAAFVDGLTGDEKVLMEFLYGTMPICDSADYEPQLMYAYVTHALFLRREKAWTRELPEDVFLNYVLYYRVNNENITDCRKWFYDMLNPLIEDLGQEDAVKEVNYWCARQASYTASDGRTLGPVGVYYSGSGRCGEESTFLVTALRSVGIAARQVYTPRWAHCDDNHAWVEAWVDGGWRFLGACEPEEVLNKGWFTNASSRAIMVHTRVFSDYISPEEGRKEEMTERDGAALFFNDTSFYAKTGKLTVQVKDEGGNPVSGAKVSFSLLNAAEYFPVSVLYTDEGGKACIHLGLGSICVQVSGNGCFLEALVQNEGDTFAELTLSKEDWEKSLAKMKAGWVEIDHRAPRDYPMHPVKLTKEQKEIGRSRKKEADKLRLQKLSGYAKDQAQALEDYPDAGKYLELSFGNAPQIHRFLKEHPGEDGVRMLSVLSQKDYRDISAEVLGEHFSYGKQVQEASFGTYLKDDENASELFWRYVANPRIRFEAITPYRSYIMETLTKEQKEAFCQEPEEIWNWIEDTISCEKSRNYHPVVTSPAGVLRTGQGGHLPKKTLFVAICRTLGIPARLNPVNQEAEYYRNHAFHDVSSPKHTEKLVRLVLKSQESPAYYADWTIGRLGGGEEQPDGCGFGTLGLFGKEFTDGVMTLMLPEGIYRLITAVRLPSGNQMEARRVLDTADFVPGADGVPECELELYLREPQISQMLEKLALDDFTLAKEDGTEVEARELIQNHTMLAFLEEGAEPTEHVLNELREQEEEVRKSGLSLVFVAARKDALENPTLADTLKRLPAQVYYDDFTELPEILARRMYTDPEKLPLVLLVSPGLIGRYASSGYNVGSVGLMLRIAKLLER